MTTVARTCSVEGCSRKHYALSYCEPHWRRFRKGDDLSRPIEARNGKQGCGVEGCNRKHDSKGLCGLHYARWVRGEALEAPVVYGYKGCIIPGCSRDHWSQRMCRRHADQAKRYNISVEGMVWVMEQPCQICGVELEKPYIDHDHSCCPGDVSCGRCVRGVLCSTCNLGLGGFKDDPDLLRSAIQYLG